MKAILFANTDWYLYNFLLSLAAALRDQGYDVLLLSPSGRYSTEILNAGFAWRAFPLQRKGTNPFVELASVFRLYRVLRNQKPHVAHFFTAKAVIYGTIAGKLAGVPNIVNAITGLGAGFSESTPLLRFIVIMLYRLSIRKTTVIFQNPDDLDVFLKHRLVTQDQTVLIPGSGVDLGLFGPSLEPTGAPVIMLAGRLLRSKGVPVFAEAARIVLQRGFSARFVLVGETQSDNPDTVEQEEISRWQAAGVIENWGWHDDMEHIIPQASIICLPTIYREGLPRILLEASACQRPIIATDTPGCRLVVRSGLNGLLIPPNDVQALVSAFETLLQDPGLRRTMGLNGRKIVEQEYSIGAIISRTMQVYRNLRPA